MVAQDVIIKTNGDEINAKVVEVGINEIKYKDPATASWLSLLFPGLGQFYNGQKNKGVIMCAIAGSSYITYFGTKSSVSHNSYARDISSATKITLCGTYIWSIADALITANSSGRNTKQNNYRNPATASWLSVMFPGLGQFYNGQTAKGVTICALYVGSWTMLFYSAVAMGEYAKNRENMITLSVIAIAGTYALSIVDAAISAGNINSRNRTLSWNLGSESRLSITPDILFANSIGTKTNYQSPAYGLSLKLDF